MQQFKIRQENLAQFLLRDEIELLSFKRERKYSLRYINVPFLPKTERNLLLRPFFSLFTPITARKSPCDQPIPLKTKKTAEKHPH